MAGWARLSPVWQVVMTQAIEAWLDNAIPIGAAVVDAGGDIVAVGRNRFPQGRLKHAETEALAAIPATVERSGCALYSSMEPCPMCTGALRIMQLGELHMACCDPAAGASELLQAGSFMRQFQCHVNRPQNDILTSINVAMMVEYRLRQGHQRWRAEWQAYDAAGYHAGEMLLQKDLYALWHAESPAAPAVYDEFYGLVS